MITIFVPYEHTKKIIRDSLNLMISETCLKDVGYKIGDKLNRDAEEKTTIGKETDKGISNNEIMYIQGDGSMVPILGENNLEYKENKLGMVYLGSDITKKVSENGKETVEIHNKRFVSSLGEGVDKFKEMLHIAALKKGLNDVKEVIFLSDGASWLAKLKSEYFPNAVHILDWYHAVEHLWITAHKLFGEDNKAKCEEWVLPLKQLLWEGKVTEILDIIKEQGFKRKKNQTPLWELHGYYLSNHDNMRYAEYREKGYYIGSGAIESANKYIVANRLKMAGMRWSTKRANALIWLRCKYFEDQWDNFWENMHVSDYLITPNSKAA